MNYEPEQFNMSLLLQYIIITVALMDKLVVVAVLMGLSLNLQLAVVPL